MRMGINNKVAADNEVVQIGEIIAFIEGTKG